MADLDLKKEEDNSKKFGIQRDGRWRGDYHFFFTDASKDARVGFGVYYPCKNLRAGGGLPGDISICFSETYAIGHVLDLIDFNSINKAEFFSDFKSAPEDIGKLVLTPSLTILLYKSKIN